MKSYRFWIILFILLGLLFLLFQQLYPLLLLLFSHGDFQQMQQHLQTLGTYGTLALALLQILQVFIFFIPAFPIQIVAGYAYGFISGTFLIYGSYLLANMLLFYSLQDSNTFLDTLSKRFSFLEHVENKQKMLILLYSIPIAPNVIKPYLSQKYQISFLVFVKVMFWASLPSILFAVVIGVCLKHHFYSLAIIIAGISCLLTLGSAIFLYRQMKKS